MAPAEVTKALEAAAAAPSDSRVKLYRDLLEDIINSGTPEDQIATNLKEWADAVLSASLGIVSSRPLLVSLILNLSKLSADNVVEVGRYLLTKLDGQSTTYEEQEALLREKLSDAYEAQEDYTAAANTLQGIHLFTSQRQISDEARVRLWIRTVRLYLEDDDTVAAEQVLNRIKNLSSTTQTWADHPDLKLHYQLSQARILDARRKFLDASVEYYTVSTSPAVTENDRLQALSAAIKTAILAPAGPQRSKTLGKLYRDERSASTQEYAILEKMFLDRLLSAKEVDAFATSLMPHQLAQTADGSTVMAKAVIEHNLLAVSKLYENISTTALARLLGLKDNNDDNNNGDNNIGDHNNGDNNIGDHNNGDHNIGDHNNGDNNTGDNNNGDSNNGNNNTGDKNRGDNNHGDNNNGDHNNGDNNNGNNNNGDNHNGDNHNDDNNNNNNNDDNNSGDNKNDDDDKGSQKMPVPGSSTTRTAAEKAEDYAARMVEQGRLKATIDQIDGVIFFEVCEGLRPGAKDSELRKWDQGVRGLVEEVERCATSISEAFPELTASVAT